jgi:putative aminopeptidase FrvX
MKKFLFKYLNSTSPSGYENESQQLWINYLKKYVDKIIVDNYGTAVGIINPESDYKVVIEAHVDEVSYRVKYISDKGYIYVAKNGGSDHQITLSKKINIHTKNGIINGFFGWPAIHVRKKIDNQPSIDNIFIDIGANSRKEVNDMGVYVGCLVTYPDKFNIINNKYYNGKALDNKLGGYILSQIAKKLKNKSIKLPFGLYIVNSVQEEVGLKGAKMIANTIKPDIAIVIDVTHDTTIPMMSKIKSGDIKCGDGPVLTFGPTIQQKLIELIENISIKNNIKYQRKVSGSSTGTDTESFAFTNSGIPSALISIPLKYMHTTVETVSITDVELTEKLLLKVLKNIKYKQNFKYLTI